MYCYKTIYCKYSEEVKFMNNNQFVKSTDLYFKCMLTLQFLHVSVVYYSMYANGGGFVSKSGFKDYFAIARIACPKVQVGQPKS